MPPTSPYISKTDFHNYLICAGYAWHARYRKELLPELDDGAQRRFRDGRVIETLAQETFPPGFTIPSFDPAEGDRVSRAAIEAGESVLFQPTALAESGLIARADVLIRGETGWHLIEIKSSSVDPENVKPASTKKHLNDVTFQWLAFRQAGIHIEKVSLLLLNRNYRRNGEINTNELFALVDVTEEVLKAQSTIQVQVEDAVATLLDSRTPAVCDCDRKTRTNRCELFSHFHPDIPERNTIYNIASIQRGPLGQALDQGVLYIEDWPDDIKLSAKQKRQVEIARSGEERSQPEKLSAFLQSMDTPLWYLDYETFQNSVPRWDGYAPHQQITFQYSLHKVDDDGNIEHFEHLAESAVEDPTPGLLHSLREHLCEQGSVVVWNKSFEHGRNKEMADRYPEYAEFLHDVNDRMVDLADAVKFGWWESPEFQGSWSLKQVLPVAAPELDYKKLEIGDGGTASEKWMQAVLDPEGTVSAQERENILAALRIYCAQDTIAMHHIREYMLRL